MKNQIHQTVKLGFTDNYSDKVYIVELYGKDDSWWVRAMYGKRRNVNCVSQIVPENYPVCYAEACEILRKTVRKKTNKGYVIEFDTVC